jgi:hypothetical protein
VNGGEVGDEGEKSLEDLELYVYTLRHVVVDCLDDSSRDRREGDGAQGDEVSEGAEGNGENWKFISWGEVSTMRIERLCRLTTFQVRCFNALSHMFIFDITNLPSSSCSFPSFGCITHFIRAEPSECM